MIIVGVTGFLVFAVQGEILGEDLAKAKGSVLCAYIYLYVNISAVI